MNAKEQQATSNKQQATNHATTYKPYNRIKRTMTILTYEQSLQCLIVLFVNDGWLNDSLDTVLRHYDGDLQESINYIIAHEVSLPADLLNSLEESSSARAAATSNVIDLITPVKNEATSARAATTNNDTKPSSTPAITKVEPKSKVVSVMNDATPIKKKSAKPHRRKPCTCKKSKCLKLYCECFAAQIMCEGCNCMDCKNFAGSDELLQRRRKQERERTKNALLILKRKRIARHKKEGMTQEEIEQKRLHKKAIQKKTNDKNKLAINARNRRYREVNKESITKKRAKMQDADNARQRKNRALRQTKIARRSIIIRAKTAGSAFFSISSLTLKSQLHLPSNFHEYKDASMFLDDPAVYCQHHMSPVDPDYLQVTESERVLIPRESVSNETRARHIPHLRGKIDQAEKYYGIWSCPDVVKAIRFFFFHYQRHYKAEEGFIFYDYIIAKSNDPNKHDFETFTQFKMGNGGGVVMKEHELLCRSSQSISPDVCIKIVCGKAEGGRTSLQNATWTIVRRNRDMEKEVCIDLD